MFGNKFILLKLGLKYLPSYDYIEAKTWPVIIEQVKERQG